MPSAAPQPQTAVLTPQDVRRGLDVSLSEGGHSTIMATLTGGIFLTGLAIFVGATNFQIALLSTLTTLSAAVQMAGSYLIERVGSRRRLCLITGVVSRLPLVLVAVLPFLALVQGNDWLVWSLIVVIAASNLFGSLYGVAWLSWMKDLVPEDEKGRYFSRRNLLCGALGLAIGLLVAKMFDYWQMACPGRWGKATGFCFLFVAATAFGLLALVYLRRMPEPPLERARKTESALGSLALPFRDRNFRILMFGYAFWTFAIYIAAPFFGVYMLKQLELSYTTINILSAVSGVACLAATNLSGWMTDRFGNKPVLIVCIFGNAFFPLLMSFTTPSSYCLLVGAHLLGVFAAGLGLGANNILLKLSPRENSAVYLAAFSTLSALAATLGPMAGGVLMKAFEHLHFHLGPFAFNDVKLVFVVAFGLRLLSIATFLAVHEPKAAPIGRMIRVLWNEVNLNPFEGFGYMVQHWMEPPVSVTRPSHRGYMVMPGASPDLDAPKPPKPDDNPFVPL